MRVRPISPNSTDQCLVGDARPRAPGLREQIREYGLIGLGSPPVARRRERGNRRIAIYTRFSSDNQKQSSTVRQRSGCEAYAISLNEGPQEVFSDEAKTGTNMERPKLQELLSRIHEFQIVIVENFDRWSREVYEAIPMAQLLEKNGIEFHCSKRRRRLSKDDIVYAAARAEADSRRRTELFSAGLDQLVESGGLPWGCNYGLKITETPGFPEVDPRTGPVVQEIFERVAAGASFSEIARSLNNRFIPGPRKGEAWRNTGISRILRNPVYIGLIQYRRRAQVEVAGKKKFVRSDTILENDNERYRIVSDELYIKANAMKPYKNLGKRDPNSTTAERLIKSVRCDCPNVANNDFVWRKGGNLFCAERLHLGKCDKSMPCIPNLGAIVLRAAYEHLFDGAEPETYASACRARLLELAAEHQQHRAQLIALRDEKNAIANRAFFADLIGGWSGPRIEANRKQLEDEISDLTDKIAAIPDMNRTTMDAVDLTSFQDKLRELEQRRPYKPTHQSDHLFLKAFQRLVPDVQICREGHIEGSATIRISLACDAMLVGDDNVEFAPDAIVERRFIFAENTLWTPARHEKMEHLAQAGTYALTDEQWDLIKDHVANPPKGRGKIPVRTVADACIFRMRTGIALNRSPSHFGNPAALKSAMLRFTYSMRLDTMIEILGADDPLWLEGLMIELFANKPRVSPSTIRPRVFAYHRQLEADFLARDRKGMLSDDQWQAVLPVVTPMALKPTGRDSHVIDTRAVFDAILIKLRTGCGWRKLPSELGDPARMYLDVCRVIYSGSWDSAVEIWAKDHPEVLHGLNLSEMEERRRSTKAERHEPAPTYPDDVWRPVHWSEVLTRNGFKPLTDKEWAFIGSVIENAAIRLVGRRRGNWGRRTIDAIFYKLSTQRSWSRIPQEMGNGQEVRRWFNRLVELGIWQELVRELRAGLPKTLDRFGYRS